MLLGVLLHADNMANNGDDSQPKLGTAPYDARFPNVNQTKHCWSNYVMYHRCRYEFDEAERWRCEHFSKIYRSLCPTTWVCAKDVFEENREC